MNKFFKSFEVGYYSMNAHFFFFIYESLKESKSACNNGHFTLTHTRIRKPVGKRHGKGVHGKTNTEEYAVKEKYEG